MRIAFVVHRYWPLVGGVEKYIHELAKALIAMGHDVDVITAALKDGLAIREVHEGVQIHRFPALRSRMRSRLWFLAHFALLQRADVVHVSNTHMLETLWRTLGILVDRRKVFLTRHGMSYVYPVPEAEKRRAVRSLRMACGVIHDGAFIEKWLGVKPDLCPDQGLSPVADDIEHTPEPPPRSATYIGRLEPDSGIGIYMDAVRRLVHEHDRAFELHVYGDGSLAGELSEQASREELPVHFHGRKPDAQRHINDTCFAFIDGRMAIQEAMARRRLVLAAYVDPLKRDYVGTEPFSPYLVAVGSGAELAERVCHYIDHPDQRRALVERAFEHARTLSWRRTAEAYLRVWQQRLADPLPGPSMLEALKLGWRLNRETNMSKEAWAQERFAQGDLGPVPSA
ncbi:MAG: glycosyltransferase family 4 protein [Phycisphaerae bacterium]|jgi:glycosyltransferase involved in cell wall biosynthesis